jgi:hypothetical protein
MVVHWFQKELDGWNSHFMGLPDHFLHFVKSGIGLAA